MKDRERRCTIRGAAVPLLNWLESLPTAVLDARPSLWVTYASAILTIGHVTGVEQKVQAAEAALRDAELDDKTRDLIGRIASIRATLAATQHQVETIIAQSCRALEYLHPDNLPERAAITWKMGYAYHLQGDRAAASQAYTEAISTCEAIGRTVIAMMAAIGLGRSRKQKTSSLWRPRPTDEPCNWQVIRRPRLPAKRISASLAYSTNGTTWMPPNITRQQSVPLARQIEHTDRSFSARYFSPA